MIEIDIIESLKRKAQDKEEQGDIVCEVKTAFPKNPPPPGIAYSKNFARFQRYGNFAIQIKD